MPACTHRQRPQWLEPAQSMPNAAYFTSRPPCGNTWTFAAVASVGLLCGKVAVPAYRK
jgi:hypothetical protein